MWAFKSDDYRYYYDLSLTIYSRAFFDAENWIVNADSDTAVHRKRGQIGHVCCWCLWIRRLMRLWCTSRWEVLNLLACFILVSSVVEYSHDSVTSSVTSSESVSLRICSHSSSKNVCFLKIFWNLWSLTPCQSFWISGNLDLREKLRHSCFLRVWTNFSNPMVHGTINITVGTF